MVSSAHIRLFSSHRATAATVSWLAGATSVPADLPAPFTNSNTTQTAASVIQAGRHGATSSRQTVRNMSGSDAVPRLTGASRLANTSARIASSCGSTARWRARRISRGEGIGRLNWGQLESLAKDALGVMQSGFHRAERRTCDGGDFIEGKFFEHMQHEHRPLRRRQFVHEREQRLALLRPHHEVARIRRTLVGRVIQQITERLLAARPPPVLHAKLVCDPEQPAPKPRIVPQRPDVPHRADKGRLHQIKTGRLMTDEFMHKGKSGS